jgi:hypothetical protein
MADITKHNIIFFLEKCETETRIPGLLSRNVFTFIGLEKYPGRGKYAHLKGSDIIIIESEKRNKRARIKLFLDLVVMLSNFSFDEIGYGKIPPAFVALVHAENGPKFPNLYEYERHYVLVARFIKQQLADKHETYVVSFSAGPLN